MDSYQQIYNKVQSEMMSVQSVKENRVSSDMNGCSAGPHQGVTL